MKASPDDVGERKSTARFFSFSLAPLNYRLYLLIYYTTYTYTVNIYVYSLSLVGCTKTKGGIAKEKKKYK
jgi:hypothetical protein